MEENAPRLTSRKKTGNTGESIACVFLGRKGYQVVARNYRRPWGEIDIIAERGGVVRFVEVKTVSRETAGAVTRESSGANYRPEELIHAAKLKKIARTAELYMMDREDDREFQIDAVVVFLDHASRRARCVLYEQVL